MAEDALFIVSLAVVVLAMGLLWVWFGIWRHRREQARLMDKVRNAPLYEPGDF